MVLKKSIPPRTTDKVKKPYIMKGITAEHKLAAIPTAKPVIDTPTKDRT